MHYDILHAEYVDGYRLRLAFADGASGEVDFSHFIEKGGVFSVLRDINLFKAFEVDLCWNTVTWRNGELDIAPETLYQKATGSWPEREQVLKVSETPPEYGSNPSAKE